MFYFNLALVAAILLDLFGLLVFELTPVKNLGNGRLCVWRYFRKIIAGLLGLLQCFGTADNTQLLSFESDETDRGGSNFLVKADLIDLQFS